jgi:ABC-type multidrug transport system ATPase subunit
MFYLAIGELMVAAVSFRDVSCKIGRQLILDRINLDVEQSAVMGILGPNGAGKTTLLSLVTGLRAAASGEVVVLDQRMPARRRQLCQHIGVVLQETALYDELTVSENLEFAASLFGLSDCRARINEVLDLLKLSERAQQIVRTLSGGMKRRVAIARALLHNPQLLVIDEPTLGVDVEARHAIWSHLRYLKSKGTTILVSTNYLDEAQALCSQVAVLREGRLLACQTPEELIAHTGNCLDVECDDSTAREIAAALHNADDVLRVEQHSAGITLFLSGESVSPETMDVITRHCRIEAFRRRAPDLAEVFKALEARA